MLRSMMYVTVGSGWSRHRTLSASIPSSSRSASRRRKTPSSRESLSPAFTFDRIASILGMEAQLRHPRDEGEGVGAPVELAEARHLFLAEGEDDVVAQIGLVHGNPIRSALSPIVAGGDLADRREPLPQRVVEALDLGRAHHSGPPRPERIDEGQAGRARPL